MESNGPDALQLPAGTWGSPHTERILQTAAVAAKLKQPLPAVEWAEPSHVIWLSCFSKCQAYSLSWSTQGWHSSDQLFGGTASHKVVAPHHIQHKPWPWETADPNLTATELKAVPQLSYAVLSKSSSTVWHRYAHTLRSCYGGVEGKSWHWKSGPHLPTAMLWHKPGHPREQPNAALGISHPEEWTKNILVSVAQVSYTAPMLDLMMIQFSEKIHN